MSKLKEIFYSLTSVKLIFFLTTILFSFQAHSYVEFFFGTHPTSTSTLKNKILFSNPITGLTHTAVYLSNACYDRSNPEKPNLIKFCLKDDPEKGLVVSFDVYTQAELGLYFMAVSRDEFLYGNYSRYSFPETFADNDIFLMDNYFYQKFPFLVNSTPFNQRLNDLIDSGVEKQIAEQLLTLLSSQKKINLSSLNDILKEMKIKLSLGKKIKAIKLAKDLREDRITVNGMSRRGVSYGLLLYKSMWSIHYPTTSYEEKMIIDYLNSEWNNPKANILTYNCASPLIKVSNDLLNLDKKVSTSLVLPYPILKNIVKRVFHAPDSMNNIFGEKVRREGAFMKYYPKLQINFDSTTYPFPSTFVHNPNMIRYYKYFKNYPVNAEVQ
ncbi:MAG: hypothetical protein HQK51_01870 [Oligoflexia bacterium]|nr:hypothetical protein [Oligoflexia bacterium]